MAEPDYGKAATIYIETQTVDADSLPKLHAYNREKRKVVTNKQITGEPSNVKFHLINQKNQ